MHKQSILIKKGDKLRTNRSSLDTEFSFGNNRVNFTTYDYEGVGGQSGQLSARELHLLKLLIERNNNLLEQSNSSVLSKLSTFMKKLNTTFA